MKKQQNDRNFVSVDQIMLFGQFLSRSLVTTVLVQANSVSVLDLAEAGDLPLFHNAAISRRLPAEDIR
jgi:hypothetical protein